MGKVVIRLNNAFIKRVRPLLVERPMALDRNFTQEEITVLAKEEQFNLDVPRQRWNNARYETLELLLRNLENQQISEHNRQVIQAFVHQQQVVYDAESICLLIYSRFRIAPRNSHSLYNTDAARSITIAQPDQKVLDAAIRREVELCADGETLGNLNISASYQFSTGADNSVTPSLHNRVATQELDAQALEQVIQQVFQVFSQTDLTVPSHNAEESNIVSYIPFLSVESFRIKFLKLFAEKIQTVSPEIQQTLLTKFFEYARLFLDEQNYPGQFSQLLLSAAAIDGQLFFNQKNYYSSQLNVLLPSLGEAIATQLNHVRQAQSEAALARRADIGPCTGNNAGIAAMLRQAEVRSAALSKEKRRLQELISNVCAVLSGKNFAVFLRAFAENPIREHIQLIGEMFAERILTISNDEKATLIQEFFEEMHSKLSLGKFNALLDVVAQLVVSRSSNESAAINAIKTELEKERYIFRYPVSEVKDNVISSTIIKRSIKTNFEESLGVYQEIQRLGDIRQPVFQATTQTFRQIWQTATDELAEAKKGTDNTKPTAARTLVVNLSNTTRLSVGDDGNVDKEKRENYQSAWNTHVSRAEPMLKQSRNYGALFADIVTSPLLFIPQLIYRATTGNWGIFSSSKIHQQVQDNLSSAPEVNPEPDVDSSSVPRAAATA